MHKKIAALLILICVIGGSCWIWKEYFQADHGLIQATGTIEATTVELNAKAAGTVKALTVKAGDTVKKGRLIAELSRNDLAAQRERDELGLVKAENNLADLLSGAREQEKREAAANVKIAATNLTRTADDFHRAEALLASGATSQVDYEKAQAAMEIARSQLEAVQAKESLLQEGSRTEVIEAARTEVERCRAVLKASEALLEDLKVASPLDGTVISKNYEDGEYVQAGASLVTVANLNDLWIKVYVPTDDLPRVKLGQKVEFTVSGSADVFTGVVEEIAAKGEFTPKTIQTKKERTNVVFGVKIRVPYSEGVLKPGMPADVSFLRG